MRTTDAWNPVQYRKFATERSRPFADLLALVRPVPGGAAVDLGCGTGELTARLHLHLGAATTVGIDSSEAMLATARALEGGGLRFEPGDIGAFAPVAAYDVVFSNAALHWVPDHPRLLRRQRDALRPGGQLAVQVPANFDHPSHALAFEVADEAPFRDLLEPGEATPVLAPERYATLLDELGFAEQHVRLQVYGHHLGSTADVVEWTKGTTLTRFERAFPPELYERYLDRYRRRLLDVLGDRSPYFYTFKRLLFWGKLTEGEQPDPGKAGATS
ncbi:MAG TPA: methyltransferase domain-containing protein [Acidimicrobiia bacterium]|nr:methyltransferase domain-containing protein [Acidimicrobiia bacterium]